MKLVSRIFATIIIVIIFGFALKNMQEVDLRFFLGYEIRGPLALVLFGVFLIGAVTGVLAMTPTFFRHRRDLSKHKKALASMQKESEARQLAAARPPQPDSVVNQ